LTGQMQMAGWFDKHAANEASKDNVRPSERVGQLFGVVIAFICAAYFTVLFTSDSGFFTSEFTTADAAMFFGIAYLGIIPGLVRTIIGRKNVSRPLDIILSISILMAAAWFLFSFPFDFSHLADELPSSLQFLLDWISDDIAKGMMVLAIIVNIFIIPYTTFLYLAVRKKLAGPV
jgi:cytochrome bd-type quinol oxidase subunit 2